jgi:transposase InsO family protein
VEEDKGLELLRDIHQGECGHHASAIAIVAKAFRHGFYWPTAKAAAEDLVKYCDGCQRFKAKSHLPASALKTIPITWPFAVWGLDMVGPFKTARGGMTHLLVAVDKFTKWIEARPIKKLDGPTAVNFIADITVRYGVPNSIITDNGTNFAKGALARYASQTGIRLDVASVAHPQSNGQAERANGLILSGIKPRLVAPLEKAPGAWIDELPAVLWSLRTTPNRSTGFTPFFLVYGSEAIIPSDIEFDSPRHAMYTEAEAKEAREDGVDLKEEACLLALSRSAIYQQKLRQYHSKKIRPLAFREGDLVLRRIQKSAGQHKLSSPWEGPFVVSKALKNNAYYLIDLRKPTRYVDTSGQETERPWNAEQLCPFYS